MLALATTHDGAVPIFLHPRDGKSSEKEQLRAAVKAVMTPLRAHAPEEQELRIAVLDRGGYREAKRKSDNDANSWWIRRVPETSTAATTALEDVEEQWHPLSDGSGDSVGRTMALPHGTERWVLVRTHAQRQAAQEQMEPKGKNTQQEWEKRLWHLSKHAFGCQTDAHPAWEKARKGKPSWLRATSARKEQQQDQHRGRPKKEVMPEQTVWSLVPHRAVDQHEVERVARKHATFLVAPTILDAQRLAPEQVISTSQEQGGVERGFRLLNDPWFRASSLFVKKPERVIALRFVMGLCLLGYRLAEHRLRRQLAATAHTVPNQVNTPTNRPTMRWMFPCFEGIDLFHIRMGSRCSTQVLGLQALHPQVLRLLGPASSPCSFFSPSTAECGPCLQNTGTREQHGRARGGLLDLIGDGVRGLGQACPQAKRSEAIHQQAPDHDHAQRHDPFGLVHTHRGRQEQGICEKAKPALDAARFLGRGGSRLIRPFLGGENGGANDPARVASRLLRNHVLGDRHAHHDLPRLGERAGIVVGPPSAFVVRVGHQRAWHVQPGRCTLVLALQGGSCISFTAHRWLPRCHVCFSHSAWTRFTRRCSVACARCSDGVLRTITLRSCPWGRSMIRLSTCTLPSSVVCPG